MFDTIRMITNMVATGAKKRDEAAAFVSELKSCRVNNAPPKVGERSPSKVTKIITSSE
jgi:polyhydroxyalkanoate synthesis regulator phasin